MAAKIIKKNEKVSPFSGLFYVMDEFNHLLAVSTDTAFLIVFLLVLWYYLSDL